MEHPRTAPDGWRVTDIVYPGSGPGDIAVAIAEKDGYLMLALRWCEGSSQIRCWQNGAHEWFVLPLTFGAAIGRTLLEMKGAGFQGLDEAGIEKLISWLAPDSLVQDCLLYGAIPAEPL